MAKTKPNQKIHVDKLQTTLDKLGQLETKPKQELTLRESIYFLRDKLKKALKKGYSYQDLSEILEEQEILISASTLKNYLMEINKESSSRKKRSKSVKNQKSNLSESASPKSSVDKSSETKNPSLSQSRSDKDLSELVTLSEKKLAQGKERVDSNNDDEELEVNSTDDTVDSSEIDSSKSKTNKELNKSSSRTRKSTKTKAKGLSNSNRDLSEDFNQY